MNLKKVQFKITYLENMFTVNVHVYVQKMNRDKYKANWH